MAHDGAAIELGSLIDDQDRRDDIAIETALGIKFRTDFCLEAAINLTLNDDFVGLDFGQNGRTLFNDQDALRDDLSFDLAADATRSPAVKFSTEMATTGQDGYGRIATGCDRFLLWALRALVLLTLAEHEISLVCRCRLTSVNGAINFKKHFRKHGQC